MGNPVIRLTDVSMRWGMREVLRDVNLTVNKHEFIAITGPNGGGKSTLLRVILKLLTPTGGRVEYLSDAGVECPKLSIGYLPQKNMIDSRFPITVREVVESGLLGKKIPDGMTSDRLVEETLEMVDLCGHSGSVIGELSGGQVQRALLGRALISSPEVLVLDEPLSYLDKHFEDKVYRILEGLSASTTILLVSHEMSVISGMADRHLTVDRTLREE